MRLWQTKKDEEPVINKKFGGSERGQVAREELKLIFNDLLTVIPLKRYRLCWEI